jgi:predicted DNA binding CopG/RHH family protein
MKTKNRKSPIKEKAHRIKANSPQNPREITPEEALRFLEDIRTLQSDIDEPTISISLRVPGNILRALRLRAKADGKKYQSLMIEYLRYGLKHCR